MKLERFSPPSQQNSQENGRSAGGREGEYPKSEEEAEAEELRNWADFRECQTRFATAGGFLTEF
jgi:hypothetical protein